MGRSHGFVIVSIAKLRRTRREKFLTQEALAEKAGVDRATISRIEINYNTAVQYGTLNKLARALELEPYELVDDVLMRDYYADDEKLEETFDYLNDDLSTLG
jgi:transcriptional regulator with XRE-family HTH domain